ncbi:hypothetical protein [Collimonas sp. OK307]|uniref:hypothetical protein n=1 Tax=Collimonas sp. OK307 TaxID=1801620 RepID=UPI001113CF0B|nr:hypothetical protein [Collimonas sp. OK307]
MREIIWTILGTKKGRVRRGIAEGNSGYFIAGIYSLVEMKNVPMQECIHFGAKAGIEPARCLQRGIFSSK